MKKRNEKYMEKIPSEWGGEYIQMNLIVIQK